MNTGVDNVATGNNNDDDNAFNVGPQDPTPLTRDHEDTDQQSNRPDQVSVLRSELNTIMEQRAHWLQLLAQIESGEIEIVTHDKTTKKPPNQGDTNNPFNDDTPKVTTQGDNLVNKDKPSVRPKSQPRINDDVKTYAEVCKTDTEPRPSVL
ncbi:unnamed protein product [Rotaria magnacalcarata]|uniref:Uncharacterized protein n=1 Tax=Rotaria magnacalcarata TaxID=392030 RepID=A0A816SS16_9BILA|nr:unnamed protein product [Rotaria magnacalcarata]